MKEVLCPLDGTAQALRALPSALRASLALGVPLRLFSAVEDHHQVARRTDWINEAVTEYGLEQAATAEVVVAPHAPEVLAERAASGSFVVMATSTQPLIHVGYLGSATERVLREAHAPVLAVGPHAETGLADVDKVVVPVDGSDLSERAIPVGVEWAERLGCDVWIVSVVEDRTDPIHHHSLVERLALANKTSSVQPQWEVLHGSDPADSIAEWADGSLVVMASHGRSGLRRLAFGSVAVATTRHATGPVLIVGPQYMSVDAQ